MGAEIKGYRLLQGFRGMPEADIEAVVNVIWRVSHLVTDLRERVLELDINPLIVSEKGKGSWQSTPGLSWIHPKILPLIFPPSPPSRERWREGDQGGRE